ncbi:MAG: hypothetical protein LC749_11860 [Actinobacteria bacterium]|nr:hypothetical protein [Actinomycetota bacterium]
MSMKSRARTRTLRTLETDEDGVQVRALGRPDGLGPPVGPQEPDPTTSMVVSGTAPSGSQWA